MTFFFYSTGKTSVLCHKQQLPDERALCEKVCKLWIQCKKGEYENIFFFFSLSEILFKSMQIFKQHGFEAFNMQGVVLVRFL